MFRKQCLGLAEACAAVEALLDEASKLPDAPIAVAVVDDSAGRSISPAWTAVLRWWSSSPSTRPTRPQSALLDTLAFAEREKGWGRELATYGDARFTYLQGGLVISSGGEGGAPRSAPRRNRRQRQDAGRTRQRLARIGLEAMK